MNVRFKRTAIAMLVAPALGLSAAQAAGEQQGKQQGKQQGQQQGAQQKTQAKRDLSNWNVSQLYAKGWSAEEMIGTEVLGEKGEDIGEVKDLFVDRKGNITRVVVEVGGFFDIGDQHIGVPWKSVTVGPDMQWIQVPLKEVENGTYSLFGRVPEGEDVDRRTDEWRVNELIGDYASLTDVPRYSIITDLVFDEGGKAQAVVVRRPRGTWGAEGWYAYPYSGYPYSGAYARTYSLPYNRATVGDHGRFDYVQFGELSRFAGARTEGRAATGQTAQPK